MNWCETSSVNGYPTIARSVSGWSVPEDVVDHREAVGPLEVAALLDVRVLVDDAGLLGREVGRGPRRQVVGDVLLEPVLAGAAGRQAVARACRTSRSRGRAT